MARVAVGDGAVLVADAFDLVGVEEVAVGIIHAGAEAHGLAEFLLDPSELGPAAGRVGVVELLSLVGVDDPGAIGVRATRGAVLLADLVTVVHVPLVGPGGRGLDPVLALGDARVGIQPPQLALAARAGAGVEGVGVVEY